MEEREVVRLLLERRLQDALDALQPFFSGEEYWELSKEYSDICNTYSSLLDFFRKGVEDSERQRVWTRLVGRTLLLTDRLYLKNRMPNIRPTDYGAPSLWTAADKSAARARLHDTQEGTTDACLLMSEMTLSLLRVFDPLKMQLLCEAALADKDDVAIRAVTALFLAVRQHGNRLPFYPSLQERLQLLADDSAFSDMLADVELQFIRSLDTERIERKMKEEIIPSMLRNPKLRGKPFITSEDLSEDTDPDWQKWLSESGVEESIQELTEMQMNGADVYMATFSQLKGYPFFQKTENWFRPFDIHDEAVEGLFPEGDEGFTLQQLILRSGTFCNSDKYSFCLTLKQLPKEQMEMLRMQMKEQEDAIREEQAETLASIQKAQGELSTRTLIRQYVQDLYRFFHLHYTRSQYTSPFDKNWLTDSERTLHDTLRLSKKSMLASTELNFQRKDYTYAKAGFEILMEQHPEAMDDATLWQKYGYCEQKTGNPHKAIDALRKADALKPDRYWNMLHLAQCFRDIQEYETALDYYQKAENMKPDNLKLTFQAALCLTNLERHDEALQHLYKLAYHQPDSPEVVRAIIHALLMLHKPQNAEKYVSQMLNSLHNDISEDDWVKIGCQKWMTQKRDEALDCWKNTDNLRSYKVLMKQYGISADDFTFICDLWKAQK